MKWVGLTGGIASGKSTVSNLFRKSGIPVVDADELARLALSPGAGPLEKILAHFGNSVLAGDGNLDRKRLGDRVFGNLPELQFLENQIHPFVQEQVVKSRARFAEEGHLFAIYDVPLLFEKNLEGQFDRILVIGCSEATQIARLEKRNGLTEVEARARIGHQLGLEEKVSRATDMIWNEGPLPDLELQVQSLIQKFRTAFGHPLVSRDE